MKIQTDHSVAYDYVEHTERLPALCLDRWSSPAFNRKLIGYLAEKAHMAATLDLGCGTGAHVASLVEDGIDAYGIEGTDFYLANQGKTLHWPDHPNPAKRDIHYCLDDYSSWHKYPDRFFTANIGFPFTLRDNEGEPAHFEVITAWEVVEHIKPEHVGAFIYNIAKHLVVGGLFIASISTQVDHKYHKSVRPRQLWLEDFRRQGLHFDKDLHAHFAGTWVRQGDNAPQSFHVVLKKESE